MKTRLLDRIAVLPGVEIVQPGERTDDEALSPERRPRHGPTRRGEVVRRCDCPRHPSSGARRQLRKPWPQIVALHHGHRTSRFAAFRDKLAMLRRTSDNAGGSSCRRRPHVPSLRRRFPKLRERHLSSPRWCPTNTSTCGEARATGRKLSAVYSGKFAKKWRTLEMCSLPVYARSTAFPWR